MVRLGARGRQRRYAKSKRAVYPVEAGSQSRRKPVSSVRVCDRSVPQQNFRPEVTAVDVLPTGVALVKLQQLNAAGNPTVADAAAARANARAGQVALPKPPPRRVVQKGAQAFQWTASDRNQDILQ